MPDLPWQWMAMLTLTGITDIVVLPEMKPILGYQWTWEGRVPSLRPRSPTELIQVSFNILRPTQNGHHFPEEILKWIILNENLWISNNISLRIVPMGPINHIPARVQIMVWHRPGVWRPQWFKMFWHLSFYTASNIKCDHWTDLIHIYIHTYISIYICKCVWVCVCHALIWGMILRLSSTVSLFVRANVYEFEIYQILYHQCGGIMLSCA